MSAPDPLDCLPIVCGNCGAARAICLEMAAGAWLFECCDCGHVFTLQVRAAASVSRETPDREVSQTNNSE